MSEGVDSEVLIFVPLNEEMKYAHELLTSQFGGASASMPFSDGMEHYLFEIKRSDRSKRHINLRRLGDMGNLKAATKMASAMFEVRPQIAVLVGIAGGLDGVSLGDVVISSAVKAIYADKIKSIDPSAERFVDLKAGVAPGKAGAYVLDERKKVLGTSYFRFRRDAVYLTAGMNKIARYLRNLARGPLENLQPVDPAEISTLKPGQENLAPKVRSGVVFGSDLVIDSEEFIQFLEDRNSDEHAAMDYYTQHNGQMNHDRYEWFASDLNIVDMETLGFLQMIKAMRDVMPMTLAFSVRGISDMAKDKTR